jgi:hypothetical protein
LNRRQLLLAAAAAPVAAAVTARAAPVEFMAGATLETAAPCRLEHLLYPQLTAADRIDSIRYMLGVGLLTPDRARQALELDWP